MSEFIPPCGGEPICLPAGVGPLLLVVVDTEEEFDWAKGFSIGAHNVTAMRCQVLAQRLFEPYRLAPTYLVDYPVASQEDGYKPLIEFLRDDRCEIGAHLHPWVNPPIEEQVCARNSYVCNLPADLERRKLTLLKTTIERNFGVAPDVYKAGRYGAGAATAAILENLGFRVDCSVYPRADLRSDGGPDFRRYSADPCWFGNDKRLLEIPLSTGFTGLLRRAGGGLHRWIGSNWAARLKLTAVFARSHLLDCVRLTPEGTTLAEAKRLTRVLWEHGEQRVFAISYHSPSLDPGHTPYVRDRRDLEHFLGWLEGYMDYFFGELRGSASTPMEVYRLASQARGRASDGKPKVHDDFRADKVRS
jgi:hypothetical protein